MNELRVITGDTTKLQNTLNDLRKDYWIAVVGFTGTSPELTVIVELDSK